MRQDSDRTRPGVRQVVEQVGDIQNQDQLRTSSTPTELSLLGRDSPVGIGLGLLCLRQPSRGWSRRSWVSQDRDSSETACILNQDQLRTSSTPTELALLGRDSPVGVTLGFCRPGLGVKQHTAASS